MIPAANWIDNFFMDHIPVLAISVPDLITADRRARIVALGDSSLYERQRRGVGIWEGEGQL